MKKKYLTLLLAGMLLAAGCGKDKPADVSTSGTETETSVSKTSVSSSKTSKTSASASVSEPEPEVETEQKLETLTLGSYEQDNDPENGPEPVEWIVLEREGDRCLVISSKILDCVPFNKGFAAADWEDSSIRKYLNGDFLKAVFSDSEQERILSVNVPSIEPAVYIEEKKAEILAAMAASGDASGNSQPEIDEKSVDIPGTTDRIFLLSDYEVKKYLPDLPDVRGDEAFAPVTAYAAANGVYVLSSGEYGDFNLKGKAPEEVIGAGWWWLRSTGASETKAMDVSATGQIRVNGHDTGESHDGIRPAMWIKTASE